MPVVDFNAMAKFVAEFGPTLAVNDHGWHGINFGRFNMLACFMPAADAARLIGNLRSAIQCADPVSVSFSGTRFDVGDILKKLQ